MKKLIIAIALFTAVQANATVLCQSISDPTYRAYFPGYMCPAGYFMVTG